MSVREQDRTNTGPSHSATSRPEEEPVDPSVQRRPTKKEKELERKKRRKENKPGHPDKLNEPAAGQGKPENRARREENKAKRERQRGRIYTAHDLDSNTATYTENAYAGRLVFPEVYATTPVDESKSVEEIVQVLMDQHLGVGDEYTRSSEIWFPIGKGMHSVCQALRSEFPPERVPARGVIVIEGVEDMDNRAEITNQLLRYPTIQAVIFMPKVIDESLVYASTKTIEVALKRCGIKASSPCDFKRNDDIEFKGDPKDERMKGSPMKYFDPWISPALPLADQKECVPASSLGMSCTEPERLTEMRLASTSYGSSTT